MPIFQSPPSLAPPPLWRTLLLERGALTGAALGLLVLLAALALLRRGRLRQGVAALLTAPLTAGALALLAAAVHTPREQLRAAAADLVRAVDQGDRTAFLSLVHGSVELVVADQSVTGATRERLADRAAALAAASIVLLDNQAASPNPGAGLSQLRVRAEVDGVPSLSWWRLAWRLDERDRWVVVRIEPLLVNGQPPGAWLADAILRGR